MSTSPAPAWSMTVGPSQLLMEPGHTARLAVTDIGTKPLAVTGSVVKVGEAGTRGVPAPGTVAGVSRAHVHRAGAHRLGDGHGREGSAGPGRGGGVSRVGRQGRWHGAGVRRGREPGGGRSRARLPHPGP